MFLGHVAMAENLLEPEGPHRRIRWFSYKGRMNYTVLERVESCKILLVDKGANRLSSKMLQNQQMARSYGAGTLPNH